ncbi:MAG TPA: IgGFc-binding protein, partial [Saprospiraceae bacterium]|nr:IgGFc-binding protein [Saprospiraceae bacterium]
MFSRFFLFTLLYLPGALLAQLDTMHFMPPFFASEAQGEQFIFLSTPSQQDITVEVRTPQGNLLRNVTISNANPDFIYFGDNEDTRLMVEANQLGIPQDDEGLIFRSDQEFYCNYRVTSNDGNHSGSITCKGTIARGRVFRPGHLITSNAFGFKSNTVSIMALENATVRFTNLPNGLDLANYGVTNGTEVFQLDAGETLTLSAVYFLFAPNDVRGFFGSLIESTGDLVVNVGSHTGGIVANNFRDIGIDQIVPMNSLGTEYILVRGNGLDVMESVIVCFHANNTELLVNGGLEGTFDAGDFLQIDEDAYTANGNMYLEASEDIAVYQMIGGLPDLATYGMNFIPPLSCLGEPEVDNIPFYNSIDDFSYDGNIIIIARNGFPVEINGIPLPASLGRPVTGNPDYLTYKISNDLGVDHITVRS